MVEYKKKFFPHLPTKDYGGLMNIGVCEMFFGGSLVLCQIVYMVLWGILLVGAAYAIGWIVYTLFTSVVSIGARKMCPNCKNGVLKEKAFTDQVPTMGPDGKKGIFRRFYLICGYGCGYSEKSRESELIT